jgi:hypothetical protein
MKKGNYCPLLKKDCIENKCAWYQQIRGINPNTGEPVDEWQCAINLLPLLLIENSKQQRSTAAAVESFRNESVVQNNTLTQILAHAINQQAALSTVQEADVRVLKDPQGKTI